MSPDLTRSNQENRKHYGYLKQKELNAGTSL